MAKNDVIVQGVITDSGGGGGRNIEWRSCGGWFNFRMNWLISCRF